MASFCREQLPAFCQKILYLMVVAALLFLPKRNASARVLVSMADIAEKATHGVVNIRTTHYTAGKDPQLDLYQFFLKGSVPKGATTHAVGSGVVIDSNGHILTNYHVIESASVIEVLFAKSKTKRRAQVIGTDLKTDLALLRVSGADSTTPLDLGDSDSLRVGDLVLAVGNPFGYGHTVTSGIISAKGRIIGAGPFDDFLQTDASIHPGNSGGPLIDVRGRVIGINTAVATEGPGIGFAIPINLAKKVVAELRSFGKVRRAFLGLVGQNLLQRDDSTGFKDNEAVYGVLAQNLVVDSPAHKAGMAIGDLLMAINQESIRNSQELQKFLGTRKARDRVTLKIYRRGKGFLNLQATLEDTPKSEDLPTSKDLF